jgi:hypothetical protein
MLHAGCSTYASHADIRAVLEVCTPYPNFGRPTLIELADAERDGSRVLVVHRTDRAIKWDIIPRKS